MTKPAERVAELDRQIAEIDAEISEFRKKAASVQANLEDKLSALRQKLQESDHLKQKLTREREAADAAAIEFLDVARELDKAETVEGLHKLGKLAATLAFAGRLTQTRYEARRLSMDRMRRLGDGQMFRPPFTSWSRLAECWLRPAPEGIAA